MVVKILLFCLNIWCAVCATTDRSHLTSIERSVDIPIKELDKKIVHFLSVPPPRIDINVQAVAHMNVLLFRYIMDYFNFLDGIGELLLDGNKEAYRLLEDIGLEGPQLLKVEMTKLSWNGIAKMYDFSEGEIEEMINTVGSINLMWSNLKKQLEWHLEKKKKTKKVKTA